MDNLLHSLNESQKAAVTSASNALAILAGPGSGKTHTLTARTAWLLQHEHLQPWNIVVATFTVKAAREMKERIGKLLGNEMAGNLILGTFHSIARRYLIRYGHLINIPKDFTIADSNDSLAILKRTVKRLRLTIDPKVARTRISNLKAKGELEQKPEKRPAAKLLEVQEFETCFEEYQLALARANSLDYDDLLVRCVELLRLHPKCVSNVQAVLIDEFQDTNYVQFDLMRLFASARKRVTIVGDPDQSIYGFRSAETKNFKRMLSQYPETVTIPLEENYRSSGAILLGALEVIQQDEARIKKSLLPTHVVGTRPVLRKLCSAGREAEWIVTEIKRILTLTGDLMNFDDVAILLRTAALSRLIEGTLGRSGIPYRMMGGLKFYDRIEIKVVLDYLRVISKPESNDALARIMNVPSRRIGEITIKSLLDEADRSSTTLWNVILDAAQGNRAPKTKLNEPANKGMSLLVNVILTGRKKMFESQPTISDVIDHVLKKTSFENHLIRTYPDDHDQRWANINELINQANDFSARIATGYEDETLPDIEGLHQAENPDTLSKFLANVALAHDIKDESDDAPKPQITISTIHAAKGLEWPVVFIPAVYNGHIPHSRAEDTNEERRLLYVAMTRAKALLYMSYPLKNTHHDDAELCQFLTSKSLKNHIEDRGPSLTASVTQSIAQVLRRPLPSETVIAQSCHALQNTQDDIWPVDGIESGKSSDKDWNRKYREGGPPAKRRRCDSELPEGKSPSESAPALWGHRTTMDKSRGFSVISTTLGGGGGGFTSAGSHMKMLAEQSSKTSNVHGVHTSSRHSSKHQKLSAGQGSIVSYVSTTSATSKPPDLPPPKSTNVPRLPSNYNKPSANLTFNAPPKSNAAISPMPPRKGLSSIDPSLANHRVNNAPLPRPKLQVDPNAPTQSPKSYNFLSSSPAQPDAEHSVGNHDARDAAENVAPAARDPEVGATRPAASMHVTTTMALLHAGAPPKRTLGVRRSMNGWSSRQARGQGHGFVPPTVVRKAA